MTATPPSWRPDLRQPADLVEEVLRLEGLEIIPSVLPQAPAGPWPDRSPEAPPGDRKVVGAQRLSSRSCRRRSCPPACSTSGVCRRRSSPVSHRGAQPAGVRPPAAGHHAAARVAGSVGAQRLPRGSRCRVVSRSPQVVEATPETRAIDRIPTDRRPTDEEIAVLDASLPRQPQHVGVVLAGLREPAGPWGPGRPVRGRRRVRGGARHRPRGRCRADTAARAASAVASGPLRRGADRRGRRRARRPTASRGGRARRACPRAPARSSWTWTPSRSPKRCPRLRCRRSPRCSRTSA